MALLKVALVIAFAVFVNAFPQLRKFDKVDGWKPTASISSLTKVSDGSSKLVAVVNITVMTWNFTQESYSMIPSFVRQNLANIPVDSEEFPENTLSVYKGESSDLPLAYNMSLTEIVVTGPKPMNAGAITLHVDLYAKKKHHSDVLRGLKNFSL